jgi:dimeric dUTPase (all-alpha-NTP-PPase superfamily)
MDLEAVFAKQMELNQKINPNFYKDLEDPEVRRQRYMQFDLALKQESAEAIDSLSWKWWKKMDDDWDNVKIELVDMLHFWVSMCTIAGLSAQEVIELYFKKNQLNFKRQEGGYKEGTYQKVVDGVEDNRHLLTKESHE